MFLSVRETGILVAAMVGLMGDDVRLLVQFRESLREGARGSGVRIRYLLPVCDISTRQGVAD